MRLWGLESLESRWMMAGDPVMNYNPNAPGLHLDGTSGADTVLVTRSGDHLKIMTNTNRGEFRYQYVLISSLSQPVIYFNGGNGNDTFFNNTDFACVAWGGAGYDTLSSDGAGTAKLFGEDQNDDLFANGPNSILVGGSGNDDLYCYDGRAYGGEGNDSLRGRNLFGGLGNDTLLGIDAGWFDGGLGDDYIRGSQFDDHLIGGPEMRPSCEFTDNDYLDAGGGLDRMWGGDGEDFLDGGADHLYDVQVAMNDSENDLIRGGIGADTFRMRFKGDYSTWEDSIFDLNPNEGDQVISSFTVGLGVGAFELPNSATHRSFAFASGMSLLTPEMGPEEFLTEYELQYGAADFGAEEVTFSVQFGDEFIWDWSFDDELLAELPPLEEGSFDGEVLDPSEIELIDLAFADEPVFDDDGLLLVDLPGLFEPEIEDAPPLTDPTEALDIAFAELYYTAPTIRRNSLRVGSFWR